MGWNSWEAFRKELDENAIKVQVDAIVKLGLRDAGYIYFVIDGGWKVPARDGKGDLVADPKKFPSGMKALADYVHARGMKFGLHQPAGIKDCGHDQPGSQNNEESRREFICPVGARLHQVRPMRLHPRRQNDAGDARLDKLVVRKGGNR